MRSADQFHNSHQSDWRPLHENPLSAANDVICQGGLDCGACCHLARARPSAPELDDYFPMQNVLKIRLRMSSLVVTPVISSSGRRAL